MGGVVLHKDCVGCLAENTTDNRPGDEALALLATLASGIPFEQVIDDLCFVHRRCVEDAAKAVQWERG